MDNFSSVIELNQYLKKNPNALAGVDIHELKLAIKRKYNISAAKLSRVRLYNHINTLKALITKHHLEFQIPKKQSRRYPRELSNLERRALASIHHRNKQRTNIAHMEQLLTANGIPIPAMVTTEPLASQVTTEPLASQVTELNTNGFNLDIYVGTLINSGEWLVM